MSCQRKRPNVKISKAEPEDCGDLPLIISLVECEDIDEDIAAIKLHVMLMQNELKKLAAKVACNNMQLCQYEVEIAKLTSEVARMQVLIDDKELEIKRLLKSFEDINSQYNKVSACYTETVTEIEFKQKELDDLQDELEGHLRKIGTFREDINMLKDERDCIQNCIRVAEDKIGKLKQERDKVSSELRQAEIDLERLSMELKDVTIRLKESEKEVAYQRRLVKDLTEERRRLAAATEQLTDAVTKMQTKICEADNCIWNLNERIEQLRTRIRHCEEKVKDLEKILAVELAEQCELVAKQKTVDMQLCATEERHAEVERILAELCKELDCALWRQNTEFDAQQARIKEMTDLLNKLLKENGELRTLMQDMGQSVVDDLLPSYGNDYPPNCACSFKKHNQSNPVGAATSTYTCTCKSKLCKEVGYCVCHRKGGYGGHYCPSNDCDCMCDNTVEPTLIQQPIVKCDPKEVTEDRRVCIEDPSKKKREAKECDCSVKLCRDIGICVCHRQFGAGHQT